MNCCGRIIEITSMDDPTPVFLCQMCGKQGPQSSFPDPPEPEPFDMNPPAPGLWSRVKSLIGA